MRRPHLNTLLASAVALMTVLVGAGCSGEVSFTTASLSEATMALGADADARPLNPTDTFSVDTPEIFCSAKLSNAPDETEILSEWVYVKGELQGYNDHVIDTYTLTTEGSRYVVFSMERPDAGWPVGEYKLVLYIDGKEELSVDFTVTDASNPFSATPSPTAPTQSAPALTEVTMALGVDANSQPVSPTSVFAQDTPEIFCTALVVNVDEPVEIVSEWYYLTGALEGVSDLLIDSVPLTVLADQYVQFSLTTPDNGWPEGEYGLILYMNGEVVQEVPFVVVADAGSSTQSTSYLSKVTMALGADDNSLPVNPASTFPVGRQRIYTTMYVSEDVPVGTMFRAEWYEIRGTTAEMIDDYEFEIEGGYDWSFWYEWGGSGWPEGEYALVLYLDDVEQARVPFSVS